MKAFLKIVIAAMLFLFLFSATSCLVLSPNKHHDNGRHRGWYKKHHDHSMEKERDKEDQGQNQAQFNGQESGNLSTVPNYLKWSPETTLKTGRN